MGTFMLLAVFLIIILIAIISVKMTRKRYKEEHPLKNRPFIILFSIAVISALVYVFGAKKIEPSIDVTLCWMMLTMGLFFSSGVVFFSGYVLVKRK